MPVSQVRAKIGLFAKIPEVVINALAKMITLAETVKVSSVLIGFTLNVKKVLFTYYGQYYLVQNR